MKLYSLLFGLALLPLPAGAVEPPTGALQAEVETDKRAATRTDPIMVQEVIAARPNPQGYLGIILGGAVPQNTDRTGVKNRVAVMDVVPGGPGAAAGVLPGDVILAINGKPVDNPTAVSTLVKAFPPGQKIVLHLFRNGKELDTAVVLGALATPAPDRNAVPLPVTINVLPGGHGPGVVIDALPGGPMIENTDVVVLLPVGRPVIGGRFVPRPGSHVPGDLPIVQPQSLHAAAYLSGQVVDTSGAPAVNALVTAYSSADNTVGAVANTLVNGAFVLRLPGPGNYRLTVTFGRGAVDRILDVPAAGLQAIKMVLPVRFQAQQVGYLGLMLREMEVGGLRRAAKVSVEEVATGSPGAAAGIQSGDVITALDGKPVLGISQFSDRIHSLPGGRKVILQVSRSGQALEVSATLGVLHLSPLQAVETTEAPGLPARALIEIEDLGVRTRFREILPPGTKTIHDDGVDVEVLTDGLRRKNEVPLPVPVR